MHELRRTPVIEIPGQASEELMAASTALAQDERMFGDLLVKVQTLSEGKVVTSIGQLRQALSKKRAAKITFSARQKAYLSALLKMERVLASPGSTPHRSESRNV